MEQRKKVLILGAEEVGRAVAGRYLSNGDQVLLCDTCKEKLAFAQAELKGAEVLEVEVGTPEKVVAAIDAAAAKLGGIDVFIHAVNNESYVPFEEMNYQQWRAVRAQSLDSAFMWGQNMGRKFRDQGTGGFIIYLIDSLCAYQDGEDVAHCAMQWGIKGMVRCMAKAFGPLGVTTNAVCASALDTKDADARRHKMALAHGVSEADVRRDAVEKTLVGRLQTADDVANMCEFLTTEGININGQALLVNGGTCFN